MKLLIEGRELIFTRSTTKAKKLSLEITPEGLVTVKVPSKTSDGDIEAFLRLHAKKIFANEDRFNNRQFISSKKSYDTDETFLFQGQAYKLSDLLETLPDSEEETQVLLKKFYTKKTKSLVQKRLTHFEKIIDVKAKSFKIVDSPASWGTCNQLKELTFNYRLSMAPLPVLDYVVIHELCHILHLNHDRSFWRRVGAFDPDFKTHQAYLARFGGVMTI